MKLTERFPKESSKDYALRMIRDNIMNIELEPGSLISENELSQELNVSRTPIREALIELSKVKIVEILPQRGSRIALIDYNLVEESRMLRMTVESGIIEKLCTSEAKIDFEPIEENLTLQEFYYKMGNYDKQLCLDNEFHHLLYTFANRELTYSLIADINIHFDRVRELSLYTDDRKYLIAEHREIAKALKNRDAERGKKLIVDHLSHYQKDKDQIIERYPQYVKL